MLMGVLDQCVLCTFLLLNKNVITALRLCFLQPAKTHIIYSEYFEGIEYKQVLSAFLWGCKESTAEAFAGTWS